MERNEHEFREADAEQLNKPEETLQEGTDGAHGMVQDRQEGEKENQDQDIQKQENDDRQGEDAEAEGQADRAEAQDLGEEGGEHGTPHAETGQGDDLQADTDPKEASDGVQDMEGAAGADQNDRADQPSTVTEESETHKQYSCSYQPPYYVPNFTVAAEPSAQAAHQTDKQKRSHSVGLVVLCVALCTAVALVVGSVGGFLCARLFSDDNGLLPSATVNVTKNNGSITVNEIVGSTGYDNLSVAEVVQLVADSVVEITTSQVQNDSFWGNYVTSGAGSGVIIDEGGFIITNNHVIEGADSITVRLTSGEEFEATVVGGDADSDIAVLSINATGLSAAVLGKSEQLKVGQEVVAIGNPLGELGGTVTDGIISAKDRQVIVDGYPMTLLQTNAAINPGNSGGGLFNMAGELIGIVNAKQSSTGIEGLGFAIPIDVAWQKASDLMQYGFVTGKVLLDFTVEEKTSEFALRENNSFFSPTYTFPAGIYIMSTEDSSLKQYDRIVSINGYSINSISDFYNIVNSLKKGDEMRLGISRLNTTSNRFEEQTVTLTVKVTEPTG